MPLARSQPPIVTGTQSRKPANSVKAALHYTFHYMSLTRKQDVLLIRWLQAKDETLFHF